MSVTYAERRGRLQTYFNATALEAWAQLTTETPVSRIRATVRQGRDRMRDLLLSWLPANMNGSSLLDAGCGTGAASVALARRGAKVTGVDVAANLIELANERAPAELAGGIDFKVGDLLDPTHGDFDHVLAMDSLIHYPVAEILRVLTDLGQRTKRSIVFTFAPRTPALTVMHTVGLMFPRSDRAPAIEPVSEALLRKRIEAAKGLSDWRIGRSERIVNGFYTSQAMELVRR